MERIEYRDVIDKSQWGNGPWQSEPDKIQWQDEATGLPCLIVRGPFGALCGYVGVPKTHPYHGLSYGDCPQECGDGWCSHRPESKLNAHGGITFSDKCTESTPEAWRQWRDRLLARADEAKQHPLGDAANAFREWKGCIDNYEAWAKRREASSICHHDPQNDNVWWFGFDCCHAGDYYPAGYIGREPPAALAIGAPTGWGTVIEYRDIAYVTKECEQLAAQLQELEP